ncbi:MAG TPA: DMT family transporter [Candidatus Saccharimonadales bacterium]|nr:DMT family transporter [Candidatus Saccharimonadales bacterium]
MWFLYALLGAVGKSYTGFFRKRMAATVSASMYMWVTYFLLLVVLSPLMVSHLAQLGKMFTGAFWVVFGAAFSLMIATQLNLEALKREELSYTAPLNSFVSIFTLLIAMLFLHENPPRLGIVGILAIFIGAYIINLKPQRLHWYDPLVRLVTSPGAQLSLGVAFGYAVNTVFMKALSNQGYDDLTILYAIILIGWVLLAFVPIRKPRELVATFRSNKAALVGATVSSFAGNFFHILAIAGTYASYAVSVRRFDSLIAVLLGWRYLKETNIRNKLIGSLVMVAGAIVMALS